MTGELLVAVVGNRTAGTRSCGEPLLGCPWSDLRSLPPDCDIHGVPSAWPVPHHTTPAAPIVWPYAPQTPPRTPQSRTPPAD